MTTATSITRKSKSNLALAFILLPKEKRHAMTVLYAFCRQIDDIADAINIEVPQKRLLLAQWREDLSKVYVNSSPSLEINQELAPIILKFQLPKTLFEELFKGVETDLEKNRFANMEELEQYCYRVASVPGLLSIEIFGYSNPKTRQYAIYLGKALQLTNVLRDVASDAKRNRIYLPLSQLHAFGVTEEEILQGIFSDRYLQLARSIAARARDFYQLASQCLPPEDRHAMIAAELMGKIYWELLKKLEQIQFNVFHNPKPKLSRARKLSLILMALAHKYLHTPRLKYGLS